MGGRLPGRPRPARRSPVLPAGSHPLPAGLPAGARAAGAGDDRRRGRVATAGPPHGRPGWGQLVERADLDRFEGAGVRGLPVPGEHLLDVAVSGVGADQQVRPLRTAPRLPQGGEVRRAGGEAGEDRVRAHQRHRAGHGVPEAHPVHAVVELVTHVVEGDGAADAGDDGLRVLEPFAAETHAPERLDADQRGRGVVLPQRLDQAGARRARADAGDHGQRRVGQGLAHQLRHLPVAPVVDRVVVLTHPVHAGVDAQEFLHPGHPSVLVESQVTLGGHLVHGGAEDLQLRPDGGGHRRRRHDVAAQSVAVADHGQGEGVDAAGAVDEGVSGADGPRLQQCAYRAQRGVDLQGLGTGENHVAGQSDETRCLDRVGDMGVQQRRTRRSTAEGHDGSLLCARSGRAAVVGGRGSGWRDRARIRASADTTLTLADE